MLAIFLLTHSNIHARTGSVFMVYTKREGAHGGGFRSPATCGEGWRGLSTEAGFHLCPNRDQRRRLTTAARAA